MTRLLRYFSLFVMLFVAVGVVSAQEDESIRGLHKVKRKETIFGISRMYDLTIDELIEANPEMKEPGYELKKGTMLKIPMQRMQISQQALFLAILVRQPAQVNQALQARQVMPVRPVITRMQASQTVLSAWA